MKLSSEERRNFLPSEANTFFRLFFFVVFIYTLYNLFLGQYSVFKVVELRKATVELDIKILSYKQKNAKGEKLLELIRENPEHFKERFARQYMQLQGRGEIILLFNQY